MVHYRKRPQKGAGRDEGAWQAFKCRIFLISSIIFYPRILDVLWLCIPRLPAQEALRACVQMSSLHYITWLAGWHPWLISDFGSLILVTESPHPKLHGRSFWWGHLCPLGYLGMFNPQPNFVNYPLCFEKLGQRMTSKATHQEPRIKSRLLLEISASLWSRTDLTLLPVQGGREENYSFTATQLFEKFSHSSGKCPFFLLHLKTGPTPQSGYKP